MRACLIYGQVHVPATSKPIVMTASGVAVASQSAETWLHGCAELFWSWRDCTKGAAEAEKQSQHVLSDFQIQDMEMFTASNSAKTVKMSQKVKDLVVSVVRCSARMLKCQYTCCLASCLSSCLSSCQHSCWTPQELLPCSAQSLSTQCS